VLRAERADACALNLLLQPGQRLYVLGDPTSLVLTGRRNPDRFIYLGEHVDRWKIVHTTGLFRGWTSQIQAVDPPVVVLQGWKTHISKRMTQWLLRHDYEPAYLGNWLVFVTAAAREAAFEQGIPLTTNPLRQTAVISNLGGEPLRSSCSS
jgi:hypothetical protein